MIGRLVLAVAAALLMAGCTGEGIGGLTVVTSGRHTIEPGSRVVGTVAIGAGTLTIDDGAAIRGDVVVGDGALVVAGSVSGDVSAIGGTIRLGPTAHIAGALRIGGDATVERAPGSRVDGGVQEGFTFSAGDGGPDPPGVAAAWAIGRAVVLVVLAAAVRQLAPRRVATAREYLVGMTAASAAYGFLVALVGLSLIVFMAFTIVLIPVALVGLVGLGLGALVGLAAGLDALATRAGGPTAGLALALAVAAIPSIPVLGTIALLVAVLASLGAATLSFQRPSIARPPGAPVGLRRRM